MGALIEISSRCGGLGELTLTLPALKSWCAEGRTVAFVQPPYIPYAPAFVGRGLPLRSLLWIAVQRDVDSRWAAAQLLRDGAAAVLLWSTTCEDRALKRLQLAAEAGKGCVFLYRPPSTVRQPSPAAVRIGLSAASRERTQLDLIKVRGGRPGQLVLSLHRPSM
jgi:cell division inhibitor SulA/protein ImuA